MPLYEYECDACGRRFEVIQKFSDPAVESCRECGKGPVHRLLSSPAIQFKGSGWYVTDYAQKGKSNSAASTDTKSDGAKSDAAAADGTSTKTAPAKADATPAPSTAKESKS